MRIRWTRAVAAAVVAVASVALAPPAGAAPDTLGTDYWVAFDSNFGPATLTLFLTGPQSASGTVAVPGLDFTAPFTVTPGEVTSVEVPPEAMLAGSDSVEDKGVHITADHEVTVYGLNRLEFTTDAFLGLPTDILGTEYLVLGYGTAEQVAAPEQFGVVATQAGTVVTITPTADIGERPAGTPYTVDLAAGQTYQAQAASLSGTLVTANHPIAVFGGNECANIPPDQSACDHVAEQLFPVTTWGKRFVTEPLATRIGGDTFRIMGSADDTTLSINGAAAGTINRGQFREQIIDGAAEIVASKPVLVAQYSNGTTFDSVTSDPFMMLVPPAEQFLASYTVTTPATGFAANFLNIVAPSSSVGSITIDGAVVPAASFTAIGSTGFSGAQVPVELGTHNVHGPGPFGLFVYGFDSFDSYGYPGGLALGAVATVTTVTVAPPSGTSFVGAQQCWTATVKDQGGVPVGGVRVDFVATGANPKTDFAIADGSGQAAFCYSGTAVGDDVITASVGLVSGTAARTWVLAPPPLPEVPFTALLPLSLVALGAGAVALRSRRRGSATAA